MLNIKAPTAHEWERDSNEWDPQVHLTGVFTDAGQRLQNLINKHSDGIIAHCFYSPLPRTYSLELQFKDELSAKNFLEEKP